MIRTTRYSLLHDYPNREQESGSSDNDYIVGQRPIVHYHAPGLSAYEVQSISVGPRFDLDGQLITDKGDYYEDCILVPASPFDAIGLRSAIDCTVYYYGINDYKYFLWFMRSEELKSKAAFYLEEADRAYESEAYFSFLIMSGAVLETIIDDRLNAKHGDTLNGKIKALFECDLNPKIAPYFRSKEELLESWNRIRDSRNMLHPKKLKVNEIREMAMFCRKIMDTTLKSSWD